MPISVSFERPPGTAWPSTQFNPADRIRISGKVTGSLGLPAPGQLTRVEVYGSLFAPLIQEGRTNLLGDYGFELTLPNAITLATVAVTSWFPVGGAERVELPIGIGTVPPPPPKPAPGTLDAITSMLPLLMLGLVFGLMGSFSDLIPGSSNQGKGGSK